LGKYEGKGWNGRAKGMERGEKKEGKAEKFGPPDVPYRSTPLVNSMN
jgi:hypothetical protein